jgi:hydroxymethylglutaryl-CoA lyase
VSDPIKIVEVGPRDGLQNQNHIIPTDVKIQFVNVLSQSGLKEIEVSSFVSPKWVPQLADAKEVFEGIKRVPGVLYSALVPNVKGLESAVQSKVDKVAVFTAASETFNQKNTNASIDESIRRFEEVIKISPVPVRAYVSTAFVCPYEGLIEPLKVEAVVDRLIDIGIQEVSIGDTIGRATVEQVSLLLELLLQKYPAQIFAMHFHDTFGKALHNVKCAEEMGIRTFDASSGGLGGCPFAPGAPGNIATEALIHTFPSRTGVDVSEVTRAYKIIQDYLKKTVLNQ